MNKAMYKKIKIVIFMVVICLLIWFLGLSPIIKFHKNEKTLEEAAKRYFELNSDKLPTGERVKTITLNALFKESYLKEDFYAPYSGKVCSLEKSWVKVYRKNGEYKYNVYLDCGILKSSIDHEGPEIKINGDSEIELNVGEEFKDPGVKSVKDNKDGNINVKSVVTKGSVDTSKIGTYEIEYVAFDKLSNKGSVKRVVTVVDKLNYRVKTDLDGKDFYVGDPSNNYIMFSHMMFRIYGLTKDNNVILVSNEDVVNINHTKIEKWLDEIFYNSIDDKYKKLLVKNKYCNMTVSESDISNSKCNSYTDERYSYIPSVFDIISVNDEKKNYLKSDTSEWLANKSDNKNAYMTKKVFFGEDHGKEYVPANVEYNYGIRPMVTIKGDILVVDGDGSFDNPYKIIKNEKAKGGDLLNTRYAGEYVSSGGLMWRIIGVASDGSTRVISNETLEDSEGRIQISDTGDSGIIDYNPTKKDNIGYYINNKSSKCFDSKDFVVHEMYVPIYKNRIIYGDEVEVKKYKVKFAAPEMYEMFSAQPREYTGHTTHSYWLVNSSKTKLIHGVIYDVGIPENEPLDFYQKFGVRVVGFINKNKIIGNGDGTFEKPYELK